MVFKLFSVPASENKAVTGAGALNAVFPVARQLAVLSLYEQAKSLSNS
jgi:hypothetical protein